jgi:hypothetical protein
MIDRFFVGKTGLQVGGIKTAIQQLIAQQKRLLESDTSMTQKT